MNTRKTKKKKAEKICLLENNPMDPTNKIVSQQQKIGKQEHYSRRIYQYIALVNGLPENKTTNTNGKVISTISKHLNIANSDEGIDRSHKV